MSTPVKSPDSSDGSVNSSQSWVDWNNQLQAYMAWINSQLKKKPGARLVEDLRNDTRDGVAFIELISVIAGESVTEVHAVPSSYVEMRENIERVLHFMSSKKIRMHHIQAKDIVDGNLKSIMRLILALAAHYKPKSVKHSNQNSRPGSKSPSVTGIAQGASAALAAARRTVAKAGSSFRRRGRESRENRHRSYYQQESSSDQFSDSDQSFTPGDHSRVVPGREIDGASANSSPTASTVYSPQSNIVSSTPKPVLNLAGGVGDSKTMEQVSCKDSGAELEDSMFTPRRDKPVEKMQYDDLMAEYLKLAEAMNLIKKELAMLQDLLLSGQPPDGEETGGGDVIEGASPADQIVILRSQLQQSHDVCSDLREELSSCKLENMQFQGVKAGLQQRLSEQETLVSELKSNLLHKDFKQQNFDSEKANILKQIQDRDKLINDLKRDMGRRDQRIDHLQNELHLQEGLTQKLKTQIKDLNDRLRAVDETGATLKARVATQDKQMARLAGRLLHTKPDQQRPPPTGADEMSVLRDSLSSLRHCFNNSDPHQHTLDTLEQGISSLMEKLPQSQNSSHSSSGSQSMYDHQVVSRKLNFDSTGDVRRSPITAIPGSSLTSFNPSKLDSPNINGQANTKVLYFMDNNATPSMLTICKPLGEVTLRDFKSTLDRPGQFRYHFKALDPEFGTVKEEISNEEAVIPGWEGKIVAWIEQDTG